MKNRQPAPRRRRAAQMGVAGTLLAVTTCLGMAMPAAAYNPAGGTMYSPTAEQVQTRNKTNNVLYPKAAQLSSGRLVAAFERSLGDPTEQTLPLYASDDHGSSWQPLTEVPAPAQATAGTPRAAEFAAYTSNWTNPYLYTLPEAVGDLPAGTTLLATLVSGQDELWAEQKAADPNWQPVRDGDRRDLAIALYANADGVGEDWEFLNIIAKGDWSGSYGDASAISEANSFKQVDPVWEPYLMTHEGQLVAYYTSEIDYVGFDPATGVLQRDPDWQTAPDTVNQVLEHRTWDGVAGSQWSDAVADEVGGTTTDSTGTQILGAGRPGMTNVVPTTDGKWILTSEFNVAKISDDPLRFWDKPRVNLPGLNTCGSPVQTVLPDPTDPSKWSLISNSGCTGDAIFVNESGRSDGTWVRYRTDVAQGYSRNLTYVPETGRVVILQGDFGGGADIRPIRFGEVDLGDSEGAYYQLVNRETGAVLGTNNTSQDSDLSGNVFPRSETAGSASDADTQYWHLIVKDDGTTTLLNKSGGRALGIWTGRAAVGQNLAQWVDDDGGDKRWQFVEREDGSVSLLSDVDPTLAITGGSAGTAVTLQPATESAAQRWELVQLAPSAQDLTERRRDTALIEADTVTAGEDVELRAAAFDPSGTPLNAERTGTVYAVTAAGAELVGAVRFDAEQRARFTVPNLPEGSTISFAVQFDESPLMWDAASLAVTDATEPPTDGEGTAPQPPATGPGTATPATGTAAAATPRTGASTERSSLASTGAEIGAFGSAAFLALALGVAMTVAVRRRRQTR